MQEVFDAESNKNRNEHNSTDLSKSLTERNNGRCKIIAYYLLKGHEQVVGTLRYKS